MSVPLQLGNGAVLLDAGTVDWTRPAYHTQRYIYPIGFKVARLQDSYLNPRKRVTYIFEVIDGGDEPAFKVTSEDDPTHFLSVYFFSGYMPCPYRYNWATVRCCWMPGPWIGPALHTTHNVTYTPSGSK
mmetsp:Transcript_57571/g.102842  ORF Transcript_57571/g.102842 Transcript_57571/m.102842 type:complete len:129 (-) Transcript_57571:53-439(-)